MLSPLVDDLRDEVIAVLKKFKPGSVLQDSNGHCGTGELRWRVLGIGSLAV